MRTTRRLRPRFHAALMGGLALTVVACESPSPPSTDLESQVRAEYSLVQNAVRTRRERENAGDLRGARLAAGEAEFHRARFLELSRNIERLLSPLPTTLSVAVSGIGITRRPTVARAPAETTRLAARIVGADSLAQPHPSHAWDMYRPRSLAVSAETRTLSDVEHDAPDPTSASLTQPRGDLYSSSHGSTSRSESGVAMDVLAVRDESTEAPRTPFLVYRQPLARDETRE